MMTSGRLPDRVVVLDVGADACLVDRDQEKLLLLRPHPSFGAATAAVRSVLPGVTVDEARKLVRRHLPDAVDLEDALYEGQPYSPPLSVRYPVTAGVLGVLLALVAFSLLVLEAIESHDAHLEQRIEQQHGIVIPDGQL